MPTTTPTRGLALVTALALALVSMPAGAAPASAETAANGSSHIAPETPPKTPGPDNTKDPAFVAMASKAFAAMGAIGEEMGQRMSDLIFDPADMPDMDGLTKMDRRQLQAAADGLARAASKARTFEQASTGVLAEAEKKVQALGAASGDPSFGDGLRDGFHERAAVLMPRFVKLSAMAAAYDDAAREEVLFLLRHYDRVVRDGRGVIGFREQHLVDACNRLVDARNRRGKAVRAWAAAMGR